VAAAASAVLQPHLRQEGFTSVLHPGYKSETRVTWSWWQGNTTGQISHWGVRGTLFHCAIHTLSQGAGAAR